MSENMYTAGFEIRLRLPERITPDQARKELLTCISFGQPMISHPWVLPDLAEPDERATLGSKALDSPDPT
jgi:hypothetical protein